MYILILTFYLILSEIKTVLKAWINPLRYKSLIKMQNRSSYKYNAYTPKDRYLSINEALRQGS